MVTVSTGWGTQWGDVGHRMASNPRLLPTAKGTFGSPGRPLWLEEMCMITEENVHKYGGKKCKAASTAWQDAFTAPYLQRQDINVVSNFPGGNLGVLTLLLLQIGLLNHIHLQGSTGALSSSPAPGFGQDLGSSGAGEVVFGCKSGTAAPHRAEDVQPRAGGSVGHSQFSHQLLGPEADEDPLGVLAVVPALHEGQEELGGIVLVRRSPW